MNHKRITVLASCVMVVAVVIAVAAFAAFAARTAPNRCRLLFGPTGDTKVTLEIQENRLLILRGSSRQTEEFEFTDNALRDGTEIDIYDVRSNARYILTSISRHQDDEPAPRDSLMIHVVIEDRTTRYEQYCDVELREPSTTPAIAHFHGPLTVSLQTINWQIPQSTRLVRGDNPTDIRATIGTIDGGTGCWTVVETHKGDKSSFPEGVFPYVEIEFPPKLAGEPAPKERFELDEFC